MSTSTGSESNRLDGKVAVVTGAGRGLGRAIATILHQSGATVVAAARTATQIDSFAAEAVAAGGKALAVPTDVTDPASVDELAATTLGTFGRVDIVVNNSGVLATIPIIDQDPADWDRVIATNLRGPYLMCRAFGRHLTEQKSGKVINVASNFALMGVPNHAAYSASKAGVIQLTKCLAVEWARHNVQVNAIAPGYFATDLNAQMRTDPDTTAKVVRAIPARRLGQAAELAPWVLLLAGSASDFMTGETIVIDGGQAAR